MEGAGVHSQAGTQEPTTNRSPHNTCRRFWIHWGFFYSLWLSGSFLINSLCNQLGLGFHYVNTGCPVFAVHGGALGTVQFVIQNLHIERPQFQNLFGETVNVQ